MTCLFAIAGLILLILLVIKWVNGIGYMMKKYPDYRAEDYLRTKKGKHEKEVWF